MSRLKERALKAAKEARSGGAFLPFPLEVLKCQALANLSPYACKLLLDISCQWKLGKNGDASAAFEKVLRQRGWRSKATLQKAINELLASGLIIKTRQGSLHQCSLYGLGWIAIDECGGKLEVKATTRPINNWLDPIMPMNKKMPSTPHVPKPIKNSDLGTPRVPDQ
jgi:hypothetical protein